METNSETMNKLLNGECLEVMKTLADNSIDMVFCDLPYGTTQNSWDTIIPFDELWAEYHRIVKIDGAIVLTAQPPFDKVLACSNLKDFRYEWIWEKNKATGHLNAKKMPMKAHENILVFYRKLPTYNPQMTTGHKPMNAVLPKSNMPAPKEKRNYNHVEERLGNPGGGTSRYPRDTVRFPVINNDDPKKFHPTQKPIPLIEYFIKTYSNPGDVVLDNCMGSGSTCIAASNLDRQFVGIEMSEEYYNLAVEWVESERRLTQFFN
ncbi:adenine-specific methyltransferase [Synechococcus phage S-CAM7]|uniref:Adenine-specific methyltransferase n=1 Tax=Synechococcus phage S-CAM7 TaxID=1883368 RepID=A0A1D8KTH4_9CAUD|nr:adenine-specific methyltransferase [Synechococcus phage S-CAM7]AOV61988.1 adenine-specific methyltransferase [Synechococcus phage S-CAM7]AOV62253.1 adenine-specific methyltransferase [Synechococcus phage S-CAM7]